jgi:integrase
VEVAVHASELLGGFAHAGGAPPQRHGAVAPALHVAAVVTADLDHGLDRVRGPQRARERWRHAEPGHGERLGADAAEPPIVKRTAPAHWTAENVATFVAATRDDRLGPLWLTLATTGLRRGEALALRWVPLPPETVSALRDHRRRQAAERLAAGELWHALDLVFALEDGSPIPPGRVTKAFRKAVERAGLPRLGPHGLRHTWATVALEAGVLTKVVADVLGHSSSTITADLYSHTTEPTTRDASARVASAMFGASRSVR